MHLQSEIKREKMSSATPRRHLSKDDKLAIIDSRYTGSDNEEDGFNDFTLWFQLEDTVLLIGTLLEALLGHLW